MPTLPFNILRSPEITVDLPCANCGYNLRGLQRTGRCPECGSDIASSVNPSRTIPFAARGTIALGLTLIGVSLLMSFLTALAICITLYDPAISRNNLYIALWIATTNLLYTAGCWLLTGPITTEVLWRFIPGDTHLRVVCILNLISLLLVPFCLRDSNLAIIALLQIPLILLWWILQVAQLSVALEEIIYRLRLPTQQPYLLVRIVQGLLITQLLLICPPFCCLTFLAQRYFAFVIAAPITLLALLLPYLAFFCLRLASQVRSHRPPEEHS